MDDVNDTGERDERATVDAIARGLESWYALLGRQVGPLSRPQRRVLTAVAARGAKARVDDIAAGVGMTMAGATRMIDTLEALGYVRHFRRPTADQRQVYVALTAEGAWALEEADRAFVAGVWSTVGTLSARERATLARLLEMVGGQEPDRARGHAP